MTMLTYIYILIHFQIESGHVMRIILFLSYSCICFFYFVNSFRTPGFSVCRYRRSLSQSIKKIVSFIILSTYIFPPVKIVYVRIIILYTYRLHQLPTILHRNAVYLNKKRYILFYLYFLVK